MRVTARFAGLDAGPDLDARLARAKLQARMFDEGTLPSLGRYTLERKIGAGGMGSVYAGHDRELDRPVAIKLLHAVGPDPKRLEREAEALAQLNHPNVVRIYANGTAGVRRFIVMELVEGETLAAWHERGHAVDEILEVYLQIGEGLAAAHAAGIIHRDLKPHNVLVGEDGRPRIVDFGLALAHRTPPSVSFGRAALEPEALTMEGAMVGTLAYMAPEQFRGKPATQATDQYAYALCLWEALFRQPPFETNSIARLIDARDAGVVRVDDGARRVPRRLIATLRRCLSPAPSDRFASMRALVEHLQALRFRRRRRWFVASGVAGVAALAAASSLGGVDARSCEPPAEALAVAWGQPRQAEVKSALDAAGDDFAGSASEVVAAFDQLAAEWRATWSSVCAAGRGQDPKLDRQMICLQRRRTEFEAVTRVLSTADTEVVANARNAVNRLRDPSTCLSAGNDHEPAPPDPACAAEVDALRSDIARATALNDVGKHELSREIAVELPRRAISCDYAPTRAEAHFVLANVQHRLGEEADAVENFTEAYWAATQAGADELAIEAGSLRLEAMVVGDEGPSEAEHWRRTIEAALTRLEEPDGLRSELLMRYGRLLQQYGRWTDSVRPLEEAVELRRRSRGPRHHSMRFTLSYLAGSLTREGKLERAAALHAEAVAITEETLGENHSDIVRLLVNASQADAYAEAFEAGHEKVTRALETLDRTGSRSPYVRGTITQNIAFFSQRLGRSEEAIAAAKAGVDGLSEFHNDPRLIAALHVLALLQAENGDLAGALASARRALSEVKKGAARIRAFPIEMLNADIHRQLGDAELSEHHLEEAERVATGQAQERHQLMRSWCSSTQPERAIPHGEFLLTLDASAWAVAHDEFAKCRVDRSLEL